MKEIEQQGEHTATPDTVHSHWLIEGSESSALQHANEVSGQNLRHDAFHGKRLSESRYTRHLKEEEDAKFTVDRVAVRGELVCPTEQSRCASRCLRIRKCGEEVSGVAAEAGNVKDGAEDCCYQLKIGRMDERR